MQKQKGISTLSVIIIIIAIAIVAIGGVFIYQYSSPKANNQPQVQNTQNNTSQTVQPSITITSPNGGESWAIGSNQIIKWQSTSTKAVVVNLMKNGNFLTSLNNPKIQSNGYLNLTIPNKICGGDGCGPLQPGSDYKIQVQLINNDGSTAVSDMSDNNFSIVAPIVQTADWKTYTNSQYGFSIKYPSDWKIQEYKDSKNIMRTLAIDPVYVDTQSEYHSIDAPAGMLTANFNYDYNNNYSVPETSFSSNNYQEVSQVNIGENNSISAVKIFIPDNGAAGTPNPFWRTRKSTEYFIGQNKITYIGGPNGEKIAKRNYPLMINYVTLISDTKYDQTIDEILGTLKVTK